MSVVLRTTVLVLLMLCAEHVNCSAADGTVVVKPDTLVQTGWMVVARQGAVAEQSDGATRAADASCSFAEGCGVPPSGKGSLHIEVGYASEDPLPKVYAGTNVLNGVSLDRITQLKLWVCPEKWDYPQGQPVTVEIAVVKTGNLRLCTFYPWGYTPTGFFGKKVWRQVDLLAPGGAWRITNFSSPGNEGDWKWLMEQYGSATIAVPPASDWPRGTLSGTGLCIKIGGCKALLQDRPHQLWGWRESCGCGAYVDSLTVGYLDAAGKEVVTTYDFEPQ